MNTHFFTISKAKNNYFFALRFHIEERNLKCENFKRFFIEKKKCLFQNFMENIIKIYLFLLFPENKI